MANQMSDMTKEEWFEKFDNYDKDKDGGISMKECKKLMQYIGLNPTKKDVEKFMKEVDKDGDCEIDFEEFYAFIQTMPDPSGELKEAFRLHDKNGDGYIDKEELKAIFTSGNIKPEEVDDLFKLVDDNNDGKIQYDEFVQLFTQ